MSDGDGAIAEVNFYSDTQTRPSRAMLEAALTADTGDEQSDRDPTTLALCERVAEMLGQEAAVFMPSGTMCNQVAIAVHVRPADEVICERTSHIVTSEGGGMASLAGAMVNMIDGDRGRFTADQLAARIRRINRYEPRSRLVSVENTANHGGGAIWDLDALAAVAERAREAGLALHMDGARLMNAAVAAGRPARDWAGLMDSVWIDFTKGLGAPVGAVLAGSRDFIGRAWQIKQRIGGAMRQSGVLAAMCDYALQHNVMRLANDHAMAGRIGDALSGMAGVARVLPVETNIVIWDLKERRAEDVMAAMMDRGIRVGALAEKRMRVVTHLDVDQAKEAKLVEALGAELS